MACPLKKPRPTRKNSMWVRTGSLPIDATLEGNAGSWRALWYIGCVVGDVEETTASKVQFDGALVDEDDVCLAVESLRDLIGDEKQWKEWKEYADRHLPRSYADLFTRVNIKKFVRYFDPLRREGTAH